MKTLHFCSFSRARAHNFLLLLLFSLLGLVLLLREIYRACARENSETWFPGPMPWSDISQGIGVDQIDGQVK